MPPRAASNRSALAALPAACTSQTSAAVPGTGRGRGGGGGAVPVKTATAAQKDVPVDIAAIGNVEAYATISVRSQVTGLLTQVRLNEGDFVKAGDHLFTIDSRPYEAQLQQAEANRRQRPDLLAARHAVPDAGRLHLHGRPPDLAESSACYEADGAAASHRVRLESIGAPDSNA